MTELCKGRLLVATPDLGDPNFERTVVLVLEHGDDGALGVVLNRPSGTDLLGPLPEWDGHAAHPQVVFSGGPVAPGAAIGLVRAGLDREAEGWAPLLGRIGTVDLGRRPEDLAVAVETLRVFAGYSGWGAGQLESEVDAGAWFVVEADSEDAFSPSPRALWRTVLRRQPGRMAIFADFPADPTVN